MNLSPAIRMLVADAKLGGYTVEASHEQFLTLRLDGPRPTTFAVHFDDAGRFTGGNRYHGDDCTAGYRTLRVLRADVVAAVAERNGR